MHLRSRNDNDFSLRYPSVVKGLTKLPEETVSDGEIVALDDESRPSFNRLQNYGSAPGGPFVNLPEAKSGRWRAGLTAKKMVDCRWLKPVHVGQFEFLEWTGENHLRHIKFIGLREDKPARDVGRE